MYHHQQAFRLLVGFLLLSFPSSWKTLADDCIDLRVHCAFDCAYREMGFLQGEDQIDVENINTFQAAYDAAYQETIANAVNHCVGNKDNMRQEAELVNTTCSSFAVKFHACVIMQETINCPPERWNDSTICEKVKGGTPICKA
uniref:Uncharacterized protein n=1 Tax=Anopheles minimus TaxID=112268 RepID=A0A182WHR4_9DIPT